MNSTKFTVFDRPVNVLIMTFETRETIMMSSSV